MPDGPSIEALLAAVAQNQVHLLRLERLDSLHQFGVEAELHDVLGVGVFGKLGVYYLVGKTTERRWLTVNPGPAHYPY